MYIQYKPHFWAQYYGFLKNLTVPLALLFVQGSRCQHFEVNAMECMEYYGMKQVSAFFSHYISFCFVPYLTFLLYNAFMISLEFDPQYHIIISAALY